MSKRKITRKKTKKQQDDILVDITDVRDQAQDFLETHQKTILGITLGLILLVGGFLAYKFLFKQPKEAEAQEQIKQAIFQFERDSFALALTNPGAGYDGFEEIVESYGGTASGNLAKYYAGISNLNLGNFEAAIDYLKDYKAAGMVTPIMKYGAMADAYSELGQFDEAIKYYKKAGSASKNDFLQAYYLKKLAMLQMRQGLTQDALSSFEQLKKSFPKSIEATDVDSYIARIK